MTRRCQLPSKWTGTIACVFIAVTWATTRYCGASIIRKSAAYSHFVALSHGAFTFSKIPSLSNQPTGLEFTFSSSFDRNPQGPHLRPVLWLWRPSLVRYAARGGYSGQFGLCIPLWIPFLVLAAPTAWLWYRDRRHPPGCCVRCVYDLSGIDSGICPECGPPATSTAQAKAKEARASSA
jgi:hypothetical protein